MKPFWEKEQTEINFEQQRQEKLSEISLCLQEFRQHKNLSIEQISNEIHIPVRLINAIENSNLSELPEPVYTRELLRKYANYLGLNGDDFADHFNIEVNKINHSKPQNKISFGLSRWLVNPIYLYVAYIFLTFVSVKTLANFLETSPLATNSITQNQITEVNLPSHKLLKNNSSASVIPVMQKKEDLPKKPDKLMVKVTVQDECWVRVTLDGKKFEQLLNKGEKYEWVAKQNLTIRAGNAGGLLVMFNEEKPKPLGKLGQVEEVTYELPSSS